MAKGGKQQRRQGQRGVPAPRLPAQPEDDDEELEEEDIAFIKQHRQGLKFLASSTLLDDAPCVRCDAVYACTPDAPERALFRPSKRRAKPATKEDVEEAYERVPRVAAEWQVRGGCSRRVASSSLASQRVRDMQCARVVAALTARRGQVEDGAVEADALPTRNALGEWEYKTAEPPTNAAAARFEKLGKRRREAETEPATHTSEPAAAAAAARAQKALELQQLQELELSATDKKNRIAAAASALMESPERNVGELKVLPWVACEQL